MKKLISAILICALALTACAFAASDLTGLEFDELLAKRQANDIALLSQADSFKLTQGVYTVGVDFPAGTYTAECGTLTAITLTDAEGAVVGEYSVKQREAVEALELSEGLVMTASGGTLTLTKAQEDLAAEKDALDQALLASDGYTAFTLKQGTYTVGLDIPAGTYSMSTMILSAIGLFHGDPRDESNLDIMYTVTNTEPIGKLELKEGVIVSISGMDLEVSRYTGLAY